ncbi:predicted protein [Sclerotinia sclerotiorum 1980 UF-70]|uniref:Uncharacterized protein n=1 Tax=Sclerotinia sclerotiorum (strain ATCC 18683 / 1980 / Ss-1) TaxID=665079 RepID=A7ERX7_SCLS1|nr:predicted protein [Sclerotinia sclerotiorum 1980 UF-70]EDN92219.1 predicted protein [Sclerotinia sclerotiorum 1980 UF-70]
MLVEKSIGDWDALVSGVVKHKMSPGRGGEKGFVEEWRVDLFSNWSVIMIMSLS